MPARHLRPNVDSVTRRGPGRPPDGAVPKTKTAVSVDTETYQTIQANVGTEREFGSFSAAVQEALTDLIRKRKLR